MSDTVNGMCSDSPIVKNCWCGDPPTIFNLKSFCHIFCNGHDTVAAANYRSAVAEWNEKMTNANRDDQDRRGSIRSGV